MREQNTRTSDRSEASVATAEVVAEAAGHFAVIGMAEDLDATGRMIKKSRA